MCGGAPAMAAPATASSDSRARLLSAACSSEPDDSRSSDHGRDSDSHCGALIHFKALAKRSTMGGNPSAWSGGMYETNEGEYTAKVNTRKRSPGTRAHAAVPAATGLPLPRIVRLALHYGYTFHHL